MCDGIGTLLHSATIEDIGWNIDQEENSKKTNQAAAEDNRIRVKKSEEEDDQPKVHPCSSMIAMETIRPEKKKFCSLQIFRFGSISASSSNSSLDDSIPLLEP